MHECWMWLEVEPDGQTGLITASIPALGNAQGPLMSRHRDIAVGLMGALAADHHRRSGNEVRLAHMREVEGD